MNLVKTVDDQRPGSSNNLISFSYDKLDKRTATYFAMANGDVLSQKTQWDNDGQPTCIYSYRSPDSDPAPDGATCPEAGDDTLITYYGYWYKNQAGTRTSSKHGMLELNGHYTTYAYDDLMRLRSAKTNTAISGGSKLRDFVYDYDRHSNLTQENTTGSTPGLETGNLWAAHNPGDEICAALRNADGAGDPGLSCGSTTSGQTSYTHDATGNMLTASGGTAATLGGFAGSYNQPSQTVSIDPPGSAGAESQAYDGVMQDRRTTSGDTDMAYGYSGSLNSQDTDTSGSEHRELFVRDPGGTLLAMIDYTGGSVGQTRFYLTDDQDSTMATVPASGTTTAVRYLYEPYGQTIRTWEDTGAGTSTTQYTEDGTASAPNNDYNPFGYVSGYTEPESGLIKFGTRYYTPRLALWSQHDPPPAQYVRRNPVNFEDPTGRECKYMGDCEDLGGSNETVDECLKQGTAAVAGTVVWTWWTGGAVALASSGAFVATTVGCGIYQIL